LLYYQTGWARQVIACSGHGHKRYCESPSHPRDTISAFPNKQTQESETRRLSGTQRMGLGFYCHRVSPFYASQPQPGPTGNLPSPLAVFQTVDQPAVVSGNYTAAGFNFAITIFPLILAYMCHPESKIVGSGRQQGIAISKSNLERRLVGSGGQRSKILTLA
jgi:hypothetical protein